MRLFTNEHSNSTVLPSASVHSPGYNTSERADRSEWRERGFSQTNARTVRWYHQASSELRPAWPTRDGIVSSQSQSSFCLLCVSQVFDSSGIFLPWMVAPHVFHREASCLLAERYYHHLNEDAPDFGMVAWVTAEGRTPFLRIAR